MKIKTVGLPSRREVLGTIAMAGAGLSATSMARAQNSALPLHTTGLEHIGMTVPDPEASANFYGRLFDPQLFKEREIADRYYVRTGIHYIAFGITDPGETPSIDHICALVEDYRNSGVREAVAAAGIEMGASPLSMPTDSDGMRLQLLGVPGGLAGSIIPGGRISQEQAAVEAVGFDHIMLAVSDLDEAHKFWGVFFGEGTRSSNPDRRWYQVDDTRLGLEKVASGQPPRVHHISLRVAGFDRDQASQRITSLGGKITNSSHDGLLQFEDLNGFLIELQAV